MATKRIILIADPDVELLRDLKRELSDEYEVIVAKDGSKALELSVLKYPDLVLFYRRCPLIGATQFARILRSNPRTEETPLIILSDEQASAESGSHLSYLHGVLVKPLNLDELKAHLAQVFRKVDTAKQVGGEAGAVSGSLDQISMPDLLQIFSVNRRTGCLEISGGQENLTAAVFLHEGRIEDASVGVARGQKALFRLLAWPGGRFSFIPNRRAASASMGGSTDSLLMEGMRQGDELQRMLPEMPPPSARLVRLVPSDGLPEGVHRVTSEIFNLAEFYPRIGELVDRALATDLEVYVAIKSLLDAQLLKVAEEPHADAARALLSNDEILELRSRVRRSGLAPAFFNAPRVAVLAADSDLLWQLGVGLSRIKEFTATNLERLTRLPLGTLGSLELDRSIRIELFMISPDVRLLPFALGLSAGTVAGLVLGTHKLPELTAPLHVVEAERRASVLFARRPGDPEVAAAPRRTVVDVADLTEAAIRDLLTTLLTRVVGADVRGVNL